MKRRDAPSMLAATVLDAEVEPVPGAPAAGAEYADATTTTGTWWKRLVCSSCFLPITQCPGLPPGHWRIGAGYLKVAK